ncbi:Vacuolar protein sorting-associated protein 4 [Diplonema papillatum]|nr:Vacuolar protein sorting-associated protein 4 [Diplonema papillatum]
MAYVDFTTKAVEEAKKAAELDEKKEYEQAHQHYIWAIERFMTAMKHEKEKRKRDIYKQKASELTDRAEKIKEYLDNARDNGGDGGSGGAATATKAKGQQKKTDDDDAKMRAGLEGAIVKEKPNVAWDDVAGLEGAKDALREAVILPIKLPQLFTGNRKPWKGILMYGPPGTGKSYLAKAVATESDTTFFSVSSADIMSKWVGESEKLVRSLFRLARENKPAIIFVDEIDSLCSARGSNDNESAQRVKTEFLVQMQGVGNDDSGVLVLAATNLPWQLDSAIRRRFERRIEIPLPEVAARAQMFKIHLGKTPHTLSDDNFEELARMSDLYSGSDINVLVRSAIMEPVRTLQLATHFKEVTGPDPHDPSKTVPNRLMPCSPGDPKGKEMTLLKLPNPELVMPPDVTMDDFLRAFRNARPSVCAADIQEHKKFTVDFGQEG